MILTPHAIVEINSRRFDSWRETDDFCEASVELTTDKTGEGVFSVFDPNFKVIDSLLTSGGMPSLTANFWFGWGADLGSSFFVGTLERVEHSGGISTFRFHDFSSKLKKQKKARYHKGKTDLQILREIAAEHNLKFSAKTKLAEGEPLDAIMQSGKTDWEFALKVAGRAGLKLFVRGETLYAVDAGTTKLTEQPVATLAFGSDFELLSGFNLSFKLPENKRGRLQKSEMRGRARGGKQLKGTVETGVRGNADVIVREDLPKHTIALANRRAGGKTNRRREYQFEHQLTTLPSFQRRIDVRDTVTLGKLGKFWSGNYVVTSVHYEFRPGSLICEFDVGGDLKN